MYSGQKNNSPPHNTLCERLLQTFLVEAVPKSLLALNSTAFGNQPLLLIFSQFSVMFKCLLVHRHPHGKPKWQSIRHSQISIKVCRFHVNPHFCAYRVCVKYTQTQISYVKKLPYMFFSHYAPYRLYYCHFSLVYPY